MIVIGNSPQLLVAVSGWPVIIPLLVAGGILAAYLRSVAEGDRKKPRRGSPA